MAGSAVFDSLAGAVINAGHAMRAIITPVRAQVTVFIRLHANAVERADELADSAAVTSVIGVEGPAFDNEFVEKWINHSR